MWMLSGGEDGLEGLGDIFEEYVVVVVFIFYGL